MEMMRAFQEEMVVSRANQERIQADLVASQAMNEELQRNLQTHTTEREAADQGPVTPPREFSTPFSTEIVEAVIPATLVRAQGVLQWDGRPGGPPCGLPYTDDAGWGLRCGAMQAVH